MRKPTNTRAPRLDRREMNFCPKCEKWNKANPGKPQRETYFADLLCSNCFGGRTTRKEMNEAIKAIDEKLKEGK